MDEAEYNMKYYVDRRGRHNASSNPKAEADNTSVHCVGHLLSSFEIRTNVFFLTYFLCFLLLSVIRLFRPR